MVKESLFENVKYCKRCNQVLNASYPKDVCPRCEEQELFEKVKDFIRENKVTEFDVAEYFQISRRRVRKWIEEGRIEYADKDLDKKIVSTRCIICGTSIKTGTMCETCQKRSEKLTTSKVEYSDGRYRSGLTSF